MADLSEAFFADNWRDADKVKAWTKDDTITAVQVEPWTAGGGLNADSFQITVTRGESGTTQYFVKFTRESGIGISQTVGLAREGIFYNWASHLPPVLPFLPKVFFAHGDMASARKVTALELVHGDQAGFFFGGNSLHNWGKDLGAITAKYPGLTEKSVVLTCFEGAAALQSVYWGKVDPLLKDANTQYLRCLDWIRGDNEASWAGVASWATNGWAKAKTALEGKGVKMPQFLSDIMDASIAKSTWAAYQDFVKTHPLTLCHGDFHPSNMIVRATPNSEGKYAIAMVDWEVVGVGSGPQDLGQFMISHSYPEARRAMEKEAVQHYVDTMKTLGADVSFEYAMEEYVQGGVGRWVWLLGIMIGGGMPAAADQYFIDQVAAFAQDHGVTAANAPLMRV